MKWAEYLGLLPVCYPPEDASLPPSQEHSLSKQKENITFIPQEKILLTVLKLIPFVFLEEFN